MGKFISALVMHFKKAKSMVKKLGAKSRELRAKCFITKFNYCSLTLFFLLLALSSPLFADIRDRVVAYVNNDAITLSELEERYAKTIEVEPDITKDEVLHNMVNRLLLLREAKKIKLEAPSENLLLKEYIDLKVRAFIRIREKEIVDFYNQHETDFQEKALETVRDEIEKILTEKTLNKRLKSHIEDLREKACVRIVLYK